MADSAKVMVGVANVEFDSVDLGYTKGFVKVNFSADTTETEVDQSDAALDETITKQNFEVVVPMAEYDLSKFEDIFPGAVYTVDGTKKKLVMSGLSGGSLSAMAKKLIIKPVGKTANEWLTLPHAVPRPSRSFAYEKENVRVYEVTFRALKGVNGYVIWGDETATS
jgi:hypothetical protein